MRLWFGDHNGHGFCFPLTTYFDFCSNHNNCFLLSCKMWFPPSTFTSLAELVEQPSLFKKGSTYFHCFSEAFTTSNIFIQWRNKYLGVDSQISISNVIVNTGSNSRYVFVTAPLPSTKYWMRPWKKSSSPLP
jgi:hypothetical protein